MKALAYLIAFAIAIWVFGLYGWIASVLWSLYLAMKLVAFMSAGNQAEVWLRARARRMARR